MPVDFSAPHFFNVMRVTRGHTTSAYLFALAALMQGLSVTFFRSQKEANLNNPTFANDVSEPIFFRISNGRRSHFFNGSQCDRTSASAAFTTKDKLKTKAVLHSKNLNTPIGGLMSAKDCDLLKRLHQAGVKRFAIKPVAGSLGKGVFLHQTAEQVFQYLRRHPDESFLVEQHISGFEHRVYVVDGQAVLAYQTVPHHVVGNGSDTVRSLFAARQERRKLNPFKIDKPADVAEVEMVLLSRGGRWADVPKNGQIVWLAANAIPDSQSDFLLSLQELPEAAKQLAVAATKAVAAYSAAVDMIIHPSGTPYVLEINIRAYIGAPSFPNSDSEYNLTLPNAMLESLFGLPRAPTPSLLSFDFQSLGAEVFREGRTSTGVDAAKFAAFS